MDPAELAELIQVGNQIRATKYLYVALVTVLYFDRLLVLKDEVKYFWGKRLTPGSSLHSISIWNRYTFNPVTFLFFFNRYYADLSFIVLSFLLMAPLNPDVCEHFTIFLPFGALIPAGVVASCLMTARVYAVYNKSKYVLIPLLTYTTIQIGVGIYIYAFPGRSRLILPPIPLDAFQVCLDLTSPRLLKGTEIIYILMQCVFDLTVFLLILWRSIHTVAVTAYSRRNLLRTLVKDGALYFLCIFTMNFSWILMIAVAPPGLKYILGVPSHAVFVTMVNRITINLRAQADVGTATQSTTTVLNLATLPKFRSAASASQYRTQGDTLMGTDTFELDTRKG